MKINRVQIRNVRAIEALDVEPGDELRIIDLREAE